MDTDPLPAAAAEAAAIFFHAPGNWTGWAFMIFTGAICLLLSAFVSGSEMAWFGLAPGDVEDLEEEDTPAAQRTLKLLRNPEKLLATILIANNLVNITLVVVLTASINAVATFNSTWLNFLVQTVFMTFLLLLFGEIFPKLVARGRTLRWVLWSTPGIAALCRLFAGPAKVMVRSTGIVNRIVTKKKENISTDELEKALEISDVKEGKDKEMLEGILSFGEREVHEIMIPRVDVTDVEIDDSWEEVMRVILESGYSRLPVYDKTQDTIRGILYSKDLLPYIDMEERPAWQSVLREAYFVPESRMLDDLLEDFRRRKMHMAIVIDEYGGTCGLVTLEDIIEEIVGEIDDEYDEADRLWHRIAPGTYIVEAKIPLADLCRVLGIEQESLGDTGDAETLAGLLLALKGDFPKVRESFTAGPITVEVLNMEKHRIVKAKVTLNGDKPED